MSGRGRGISNAPAWMAQQQQQQPGGMPFEGGGGARGGPPPPGDYYRNDRGGGGYGGGGGGGGGGYQQQYHRGGGDYRDRDRDSRGGSFYGGGGDYGRRGGPGGYGGGGGPGYGGQNRRGPPPSQHQRGRGPPPRSSENNNNNQMVTFRSLEEEREWVEERRRKRQKRPSKFDVLPTPEQLILQQQQQQQQLLLASSSISLTVSSAATTGTPQQTRHARRLYVGNLSPHVTEDHIHQRFREAIAIASGSNTSDEDPILSVYINHERRYCFLEFKTVEMTTACMQLDGLDVLGIKCKIKRPNDYNEMSAPKPMHLPQLDVSRLGIIGGTVLDGPNKIFIGGLHYHLTQDQIIELLQAFGKLKAFHLVCSADDSGAVRSKGYCFAEYVDPNVTPVAIQGLNGMDIGGGKSLTARLAGDRGSVAGTMTMSMPDIPAVSPHGAPPADHTIVHGYDVEELVDAALGQKPMPTAPVYLDAMGMPLTRIVPVALIAAANMAMNNMSSAQPQQQAVTVLPPPSPPQPQSQVQTADGSVPTRILVLHNMVTEDDLATDDDYNGLLEEVQEECAKYGQLVETRIPREGNGKGKIFLEYSTPQQAQAAGAELAGRQFGSSYVETTYYSEGAFRAGLLQ